MTSFQSQYLSCAPLACTTPRIRLGIDSINRRIRSCEILPPLLLKSILQFLQTLRRWLMTTHESIQAIHRCSIGFISRDLKGQGSTVTLWLARSLTVARAVCGRALSCWKTSLRRFIASSMCGVKTSSVYRAALRLPWMCTSWVFRRRIWHPTSSHFLRRNWRTAHSGVCRQVYSHLFCSMNLASRCRRLSTAPK
jgi:hypothetical protein